MCTTGSLSGQYQVWYGVSYWHHETGARHAGSTRGGVPSGRCTYVDVSRLRAGAAMIGQSGSGKVLSNTRLGTT